jgi:hypothetical protein
MHHVAVLEFIVLAFELHPADLLRALLTLAREVVIECSIPEA